MTYLHSMAAKRSAAVDISAIMGNILVIRGHRVLLDSDLASLYQVETKALTRAVRRNAKRFPEDFMFQLAAEETGSLRSQSGAFKTGRGKHRKYAPYVFTEQGVAMLSSVLNSDRAVQVNIEIMRAFVRLRESVSRLDPAFFVGRLVAEMRLPADADTVRRTFYVTANNMVTSADFDVIDVNKYMTVMRNTAAKAQAARVRDAMIAIRDILQSVPKND
jgi:ORF6N domain